jgi:hypothetical protein
MERTMDRPHLAGQRGASLLEAIVALAVLLIGLLGMAQLQVWGVASNYGARAHAQALDIGRELSGALERLPFDDPLLAPTVGDPPPASFGRVLQPNGTLDASGFVSWDDAMAASLPNVRPDAVFSRDTVDSSLPAFQRRWAVWVPPGQAAAYTRVVAVSVIFREKAFQQAREVTFLTQVSNVGASVSNAAAYR